MKKNIILVFLLIALLASCTTFGENSVYTEDQSQPPFQRIENIPEGKCVVYMYRLPSLMGSAAIYNVKVLEAGEESFPRPDNKAYAWLKKNGYVPIILDADKLYFIGGAGTEVILKRKGSKIEYECIAGSGEALLTHAPFSRRKQTDLISNGEHLESYEAVDESMLLEEISHTRLASFLKTHIQKP